MLHIQMCQTETRAITGKILLMVIIYGFVFEMQSGMNECDHRISYRRLSSSKKGLKNSGLNEDCNPDLYDASGRTLHWHRRGQGSNPRLGMNSSGNSCYCLRSAKKCDDQIRSSQNSIILQIIYTNTHCHLHKPVAFSMLNRDQSRYSGSLSFFTSGRVTNLLNQIEDMYTILCSVNAKQVRQQI